MTGFAGLSSRARRHAQSPPSRLSRLVGNVTITGDDATDLDVSSTFVLHESRTRGLTTWAGRVDHTVRRRPDGLRMVRKTVRLVDNDQALSTLAFLV